MFYTKQIFPLQTRTFIVGEEYRVYGKVCTFIRSTTKGFNFYYHDGQRLMFLKRHFYSVNHKRKHVALSLGQVKIRLPYMFSQAIQNKEKHNAS